MIYFPKLLFLPAMYLIATRIFVRFALSCVDYDAEPVLCVCFGTLNWLAKINHFTAAGVEPFGARKMSLHTTS